MGVLQGNRASAVIAVCLLVGTVMTDASRRPLSYTRPPHIGIGGCPLLPAPPPPPPGASLGDGLSLTDTYNRICENDNDCPGRKICCATGACCGTFCYDPGYFPIIFQKH